MSVRTITISIFLFLGLWTPCLRISEGRTPWWYDEDPPPRSDDNEKTEYAFARLVYPSYGGVADRIWNMRGNWTIDYPEADRQFVQGVRRLTRMHTRSIEQVSISSRRNLQLALDLRRRGGHWALTDEQASKLRDYLLRGGFLMIDDFHGTHEWEIFMQSMREFSPTGLWWTSRTRMPSSTSSTIWMNDSRSRASLRSARPDL